MMASTKHLFVALSLPFLLALASPFPAYAKKSEWEQLNKQSTALYEQGDLEKAEETIKKALELAERTYGPEHPNVATSLNNLATLYLRQKRFQEVLPLIQGALAIRENHFGYDHPSVAVSLGNLAAYYRAGGLTSVAEPLFRKALLMIIKDVGPEHPMTAQGLNNLASVLMDQQRYDEAEPLFHRALKIQQNTREPITRSPKRRRQILHCSSRQSKNNQKNKHQILFPPAPLKMYPPLDVQRYDCR